VPGCHCGLKLSTGLPGVMHVICQWCVIGAGGLKDVRGPVQREVGAALVWVPTGRR
jgi:predicted DsbA family dithiol-disulfide isomerase